mgnify:CR=1 FL=1
MKKKLGVNIDHVATIRNARNELYPNPIDAATLCTKNGADSITIHLREDRRHIRDIDLIRIKRKLKRPLNLEMAPTNEMLRIALKHKPNFICLVPEKRKEITTEGGLNHKRNKKKLLKIINKLKRRKIFLLKPFMAGVVLQTVQAVCLVCNRIGTIWERVSPTGIFNTKHRVSI